MKRLYPSILIIFSIIFIRCNETGTGVEHIFNPPPEISWELIGLDSNMVVSVYKTTDGRILAGTNYGLFISSDSMYSWQLIDQVISSSTVTCLTHYAGEIILAGTSGSGVFYSTDNGKRWIRTGLRGKLVSAVSADNTGRIIAATKGDGIFITDSLNGSWYSSNIGLESLIFSSLLITQDNKLFAGGTGVYRSDDNGANWTLKNKGLGNWPVQSLIRDAAGYIDAGTDNGGFFRTNDNGENWIQANNGLSNIELTTLTMNSQGHIFAGTWRGGIFRSTDNGMNWTSADSGLTTKMVHILYSHDEILYAGTFKGLFKTTSVTTNQ